jgi:hypothetical protein
MDGNITLRWRECTKLFKLGKEKKNPLSLKALMEKVSFEI